jgi:hypothetical protein
MSRQQRRPSWVPSTVVRGEGCAPWQRGAWLIAGLAVFQFGCSGSVSTDAKSASGAVTKRDSAVTHEPCDIQAKGAEKLDGNGDGRADITIVRDGGREICRAVDLNFDGNIDSWIYLDEAGKLRRREFAYGRDNRVVEIRRYKGGTLSEMDRVTTLGGRLDTWHFYEGGRLVRTERDSDGDGNIDQWWDYPQPDKPKCPVIHADVDGDGRPDPAADVDVCKETGYVPPERTKYKYKSPDFSRPEGLPTENDVTEQKPEEAAPAKPEAAKPAKPEEAKPAAPAKKKASDEGGF